MFKKRVVKSNGANSIKSTGIASKRSFSVGDEDSDDIQPIIKRDDSNMSDPFKKRQKLEKDTTDPIVIDNKVIANHTEANVEEESRSQIYKDPIESKTKSKIKPLPAHITVTTLTDFQPDVCKDFMQTGYCGYGDTCKFLHIRNESKATKVIEKEWETVGAGESKSNSKPEPEHQAEILPFKCVLCKKDYQNPIKTECGHIYCKSCYLTRYKSGKVKCFICSKDTNGIIIPLSKSQLQKLIN
ncbi:GNAT family acetyltransferase with 2 zinc fingers [Scheffersomyces amazonensis]|uniref:GNAT family acetyltransferase with 2 zinc fingers n=1 Tax=Scheffersomyces amazonensis TaxID=1078765 RepID=UPI00315D9957